MYKTIKDKPRHTRITRKFTEFILLFLRTTTVRNHDDITEVLSVGFIG